jgi:hypothetical protein
MNFKELLTKDMRDLEVVLASAEAIAAAMDKLLAHGADLGDMQHEPACHVHMLGIHLVRAQARLFKLRLWTERSGW